MSNKREMVWKPIHTAPKDRRILLYRPTARDWAKVAIGAYNDQRHRKNPNPYWEMETSEGGVFDAREWWPTHWMDLPEPPRGE